MPLLPSISVIIPTCELGSSLEACLEALEAQTVARHTYELIVVSDGAVDPSVEPWFDQSEPSCSAVRSAGSHTRREIRVEPSLPPDLGRGTPGAGRILLSHPQAGAAAARNLGAANARGAILLFIDDDCIAESNWIEAMTAPFADAAVAGVGGVVCTRQSGFIPRFVQLEYDHRYRRVAEHEHIDFLSTATAAYRRRVFEAVGGFDETLGGAEDMEFSYRLAGRGHKMVFAPQAVVYHPHPRSLWTYVRRKAHYGFWRMAVYGKHPRKAVADSRTPQTQKLQIGLLCLLAPTLIAAPLWPGSIWLAGALLALFLLLSFPFWWWALRQDLIVGILSPFFLFAGTAGAAAGVTTGLVSRWLERWRNRENG